MAIITNNVVSKEKMREIQSRTLNELSDILQKSFGPIGSNTCIKKENALSRYTKDGHTIIGAIHYNGIIEQSIKDDIESITRHIVKTVGDGTTSAVILSSLIFDALIRIENENMYKPVEIVNALNSVVQKISETIKKSATPFTSQDAYDITMISTNGNKDIAECIKEIYDEFGNGVYIDVSPAVANEFVVKSYNGMTLNTGYCDPCYVTNRVNNTAEVDHPHIYFFEHPIDTRELGVYLDAIISTNIISPVNAGTYDAIVPTVIFAPKISQDCTSTMDALTSNMANMPMNNRLPICIITDYMDTDELNDLAQMCGAKLIRKYIDPKIYAEDVKRGKAPTPETIDGWAGTCDRVIAYSDKTTFIRPSKMYNEDGGYSDLYNSIVSWLDTEIKHATADGENIMNTSKLKRRLNSLKSNMVELFVGGITQMDRDSLRDLVEDAVLNVRSAAENGVGFGANMSASVAVSDHFYAISDKQSLEANIWAAINIAYKELFDILYNGTAACKAHSGDNYYEFAVTMVKHYSKVFNIATNEWSTNVKTSIMSDIIILDTVAKIIGIMATCNQFLVPTAMHNVYDTKETNPDNEIDLTQRY